MSYDYRAPAAIYLYYPNGLPYHRQAFDSEHEAMLLLQEFTAGTQTRAFPTGITQATREGMIVPLVSADILLTRAGQPDTLVFRAVIRLAPVPPTLKPGDHHDSRNSPHPE